MHILDMLFRFHFAGGDGVGGAFEGGGIGGEGDDGIAFGFKRPEHGLRLLVVIFEKIAFVGFADGVGDDSFGAHVYHGFQNMTFTRQKPVCIKR